MFTDDVKNMLGENLLEEFIDKTSFVLSQTSGAAWSVSHSGYVILFAPAVGYRTLNETLAEDGWQLLCENGVSIGRDTCYFIDFALNNVYVRYCETGEKFTYGTWTLAFGAADPDEEYYVFSYDKPESNVIKNVQFYLHKLIALSHCMVLIHSMNNPYAKTQRVYPNIVF